MFPLRSCNILMSHFCIIIINIRFIIQILVFKYSPIYCTSIFYQKLKFLAFRTMQQSGLHLKNKSFSPFLFQCRGYLIIIFDYFLSQLFQLMNMNLKAISNINNSKNKNLRQQQKMQKLYESRKEKYFEEKVQKMQAVSPDKYGKGAYADLSYTPYKLAENVLYREAVTLKKYEEGTNKLRQFQVDNSFLRDKIKQLEKQRVGIEDSLIHQIKMYKEMLSDMEKSHQARTKEIQKSFKEEIHKLIADKQLEAKFWQSEKQALQKRIEELEEINKRLEDQLSNRSSDFQNMIKHNEQLKAKMEQTKNMIKQAQQKVRQVQQKAKEDIVQIKQMMLENEDMWRCKLDKLLHQKNLQIQDICKLHRSQLDYLDRKRQQEIRTKNQEIRNLLRTFDDQSNRMNDIINARDKQIDIMLEQKAKGKSQFLDLTKNYEQQINALVHQKRRYIEECQILRHQVQALQLMGPNNPKIAQLSSQNELLSREIQNLKQVLYESSDEMQRCRQQFLRMGRQKDQILLQMKNLKFQNESLQRATRDREQQAENWKNNYFRQKRF